MYCKKLLLKAKLRSRIRIADGRAKPIDLLAKYIVDQEEGSTNAMADVSGALEIMEPVQFLVGLGIDDLEDLLEDIRVMKFIICLFFKFITLLTKYSH